jgi:hypothetical protein
LLSAVCARNCSYKQRIPVPTASKLFTIEGVMNDKEALRLLRQHLTREFGIENLSTPARATA